MTGSPDAFRQPIFDGHNDLLLRLWLSQSDNPTDDFLHGSLDDHLDMTRIRQGGFAGELFAVFVPPVQYVKQLQPDYDERQYSALAITEAQIALLHNVAERSQGQARVCRTTGEIEQCTEQDLLAMVLYIEGAEALDVGYSQPDGWVAAGLASTGPLWNLPNAFSYRVTGNFPGSPGSGDGLTQAGLNLLRVRNQQRLLIDLSQTTSLSIATTTPRTYE